MRVDLAAKYPDIHVSLVMPGLVSTEFAKNAIGSSGGAAPVWSANSPTQSAEEVAAAIAGVIERPVAEVYTNPASAAMARRYFEDVNAFEDSLRPTRARA